MRKLQRQIGEKFQGIDKFGQSIGVFYRGSDVFQTKLGALCTLVVFGLVLSYLLFDIIQVYTMSHPEISIERKHMTTRQLEELLPISFSDYRFHMGVVLTDGDYQPIDVPP